MNLDKINQRNEDRLAKLGFDSRLDLTANSQITYTGDKPTRENEQLKQVDSLLFDLLRSNEMPPTSSNKTS